MGVELIFTIQNVNIYLVENWVKKYSLGTNHSYNHLLFITGYFFGIIQSINGVISTYNW